MTKKPKKKEAENDTTDKQINVAFFCFFNYEIHEFILLFFLSFLIFPSIFFCLGSRKGRRENNIYSRGN